jgi:hypothetical protein
MSYRNLRTHLLVAHIATSVGFFGAVLVFFCLAVTGLSSAESSLANASYAVMSQIIWLVIVPLAVLSLAVGVLQSVRSPWGLARHYWVLVKLIMSVAITAVLLAQTPTIDRLGDAGMRAAISNADFGARYSVMVHSGAGLMVLLVVLILSVAKPSGRTPWGPPRHGNGASV